MNTALNSFLISNKLISITYNLILIIQSSKKKEIELWILKINFRSKFLNIFALKEKIHTF